MMVLEHWLLTGFAILAVLSVILVVLVDPKYAFICVGGMMLLIVGVWLNTQAYKAKNDPIIIRQEIVQVEVQLSAYRYKRGWWVVFKSADGSVHEVRTPCSNVPQGKARVLEATLKYPENIVTKRIQPQSFCPV